MTLLLEVGGFELIGNSTTVTSKAGDELKAIKEVGSGEDSDVGSMESVLGEQEAIVVASDSARFKLEEKTCAYNNLRH